MENQTEIIKQQMAETREALSSKVAALEEKVISTVQDTTETVAQTVGAVKDTVAETVDTVKDAVQDTVATVTGTIDKSVETVKQTFDLRGHVEKYPWAMVAGSVAVGFIGGKLLSSGMGHPGVHGYGSITPGPQGTTQPRTAESYRESLAAPTHGGGFGLFDQVGESMKPIMQKLGSLAIGATTSLLGELVLESVGPALRKELEPMVRDFTTALGGKPIDAQGLFATSEEPESRSHTRPQNGAAMAEGSSRR